LGDANRKPVVRAEVIGDLLVGKGQNELTLTELRNSAGGTFLYHLRLAIGAVPLTFAIFGVVVATRRWRRAAAIGISCAGVVGCVLALNFGRSFNYHEVMPPRVAAWMPHILLAWATILIARLFAASRPEVTRRRA
jgi:lipopolysaccharide export LptBFGC system permease protein LptF